jgi:hypothetical protein
VSRCPNDSMYAVRSTDIRIVSVECPMGRLSFYATRFHVSFRRAGSGKASLATVSQKMSLRYLKLVLQKEVLLARFSTMFFSTIDNRQSTIDKTRNSSRLDDDDTLSAQQDNTDYTLHTELGTGTGNIRVLCRLRVVWS